jgi:hypothetical protein
MSSGGNNPKRRKVKPEEWAATFNDKHPPHSPQKFLKRPARILDRPLSTLRQFLIYSLRDFKTKQANSQYNSK